MNGNEIIGVCNIQKITDNNPSLSFHFKNLF